MTTSPTIYSGIPFDLALPYPTATTNRNLCACLSASLDPMLSYVGEIGIICLIEDLPSGLGLSFSVGGITQLYLLNRSDGRCTGLEGHQSPMHSSVWGTVLHAQSTSSVSPPSSNNSNNNMEAHVV